MAVLVNRSTGDVLAGRVAFALKPLQRIVGLLPRTHLDPEEGLWFDRCAAVHTLGMRVLVDLVFLDPHLRVVRVDHAVRPGRALVWCHGATSVLEMGYGFLAGCDLLVGDLLAFDRVLTA